MKRLAVGIVAAAATLGVAGTASAAPPERVEVWTCDGEEVEITVMGRVGVIDGQRYLAHNLVIEGTFDPTGPAPSRTVHRHAVDEWTHRRAGLHQDVHRDGRGRHGHSHAHTERDPHRLTPLGGK